MFQVGPLVEAEGTQPILLRTGQNQTPEWFGTNPIPYSRAVALPKPSPNSSDPLAWSQEETHMTYVIAQPCIGVKDASCVDVWPVDCISSDDDFEQYFIDPNECIDCGV